MNRALDNYNYATDARTQGPAVKPVLHTYGCGVCGATWGYDDPDDKTCDCEEFVSAHLEAELPMHWVVCPVCRGEGKHVNPSIDCNGLTGADFAEDPDFADEYMRGTYDQTCNRCEGKRVVPGVDWDALTPAERKAYEKQLREEADDRACELAEIRAGC